MPAKKNQKKTDLSKEIEVIPETTPEIVEETSDDFDSGAFGGAFGNAFGGGIEVKFNTDGSTSKIKKKKVTSKDEGVVLRSSSRTFTVQREIPEPVKKDIKHDTWVDEITRAYEKRQKTPDILTAPVEKNVDQPQPEPEKPRQPVYTPQAAPTPFRSKIIVGEVKEVKPESKTSAPVTAKTVADDRGTAFAKTFLKKTRPSYPQKKPFTPFRKDFQRDFRGPRSKTKNPPTLKTRISGKSNQNKLELVKFAGANIQRRPPVVAIMGHVDHGKSTLLDYIRKSNIADREIGGITQKMSAYEIEHNGQKITFLDTPGHEAFTHMRTRGASAADIAILIVSAEDGVKPQTLDALKSINDAGTPYFIGASKIDKANADIEHTKQSLAENSIFVEGYGGDISLVPFSGKSGEGVSDLLDMILLMADVADIKAAYDVPAECLPIEISRDKSKGVQATLIVKNGTLETGAYIVSGGDISPIRSIENFEGTQIKEAFPGQPVRVLGWVSEPHVGEMCIMTKDKSTAELVAAEQKSILQLAEEVNGKVVEKPAAINIRALYGLEKNDTWTFPLVLKADSVGTLDALKQEIGKMAFDRINIRIIRSETGDVNENDIKLAQGSPDSVVLGYNAKIDATARRLAETTKTTIETFDIIYKLLEWVREEALKRAPRIRVEESHSTLRILKVFSRTKNKQVLGGKVEAGTMSLGNTVKILRRDNEIGRGEIVELQQMRVSTKSVDEGAECGLMVEAKIEIVPGDVLSAVTFIEK